MENINKIKSYNTTNTIINEDNKKIKRDYPTTNETNNREINENDPIISENNRLGINNNHNSLPIVNDSSLNLTHAHTDNSLITNNKSNIIFNNYMFKKLTNVKYFNQSSTSFNDDDYSKTNENDRIEIIDNLTTITDSNNIEINANNRLEISDNHPIVNDNNRVEINNNLQSLLVVNDLTINLTHAHSDNSLITNDNSSIKLTNFLFENYNNDKCFNPINTTINENKINTNIVKLPKINEDINLEIKDNNSLKINNNLPIFSDNINLEINSTFPSVNDDNRLEINNKSQSLLLVNETNMNLTHAHNNNSFKCKDFNNNNQINNFMSNNLTNDKCFNPINTTAHDDFRVGIITNPSSDIVVHDRCAEMSSAHVKNTPTKNNEISDIQFNNSIFENYKINTYDNLNINIFNPPIITDHNNLIIYTNPSSVGLDNPITVKNDSAHVIPDSSCPGMKEPIMKLEKNVKNICISDINYELVKTIQRLETEDDNLKNIIVFYDSKMENITQKIEIIIQDYHSRNENLKDENIKLSQNLNELASKTRLVNNKSDEMKRILLKQRENESKLMRINSDLRQGLDLAAIKSNELLKEMEDYKMRTDDEVAKLNAAIKIGNVKMSTLEKNIADLVHQNKELTQICEELLGKHS